MPNIIIHPWGETPGERSLRQKGHRTKSEGIFETGFTVSAHELRKDNVNQLTAHITGALHKIHCHMAENQWDDDKVCVTVGMQARNGWTKDVEGQWIEEGSEGWLDKIAQKAK